MILYLYLKNANVLVHVVFQIDFKLKTILVENRKKKIVRCMDGEGVNGMN